VFLPAERAACSRRSSDRRPGRPRRRRRAGRGGQPSASLWSRTFSAWRRRRASTRTRFRPGTARPPGRAPARRHWRGECIPCKAMAPIRAEIRREYQGVLAVDFYDVWKNPAAARHFGIRVIPTLIFYDASGRELGRREGYVTRRRTSWRQWGRWGVPPCVPLRVEVDGGPAVGCCSGGWPRARCWRLRRPLAGAWRACS
jgi:thioredoxin 1